MSIVRVTGAWTQLLVEWLNREALAAPELRSLLAHWATQEVVNFDAWSQALERAVALRPEQVGHGIAIGALVEPRHVGVLGYLALATNNLGEAMAIYQRYERLFYGVDLVELAVEADAMEIRWQLNSEKVSLLTDTVGIAALVAFIRRQLENPPGLSGVSFRQAAPERADEYDAFEAFFGCPVSFGSRYTSIRFPLSYLSIPNPRADLGLRELLDRQASALLEAMPGAEALDKALQQVLLRLLPDGAVSLDRAARALHLSARTLQRRLEEKGTSWQTVLDKTREALARQYLGDRSLSLGDIALLLGYSEQSAFNHAVRRWTGTTPRQIRKGSALAKVPV